MSDQPTLFEGAPQSDGLRRIAAALGVSADPVVVLDAVCDLKAQLRYVRLALAETRRAAAVGSKVCRTCRWFVPQCAAGQEWARRGSGCLHWEE